MVVEKKLSKATPCKIKLCGCSADIKFKSMPNDNGDYILTAYWEICDFELRKRAEELAKRTVIIKNVGNIKNE